MTKTQDERRQNTVKIPDSLVFFMTHNQQTPIQCHHAVSKKHINSYTTDTTVEPTHFPIYPRIKNNFFKIWLDNNIYIAVSYDE